MNSKKCILLVEDDIGLAELIKEKIEETGFYCHHITTGIEAFNWLKNNNSPELILLDYSLPDFTGLKLIKKLEEENIPKPVFVVTTGYGDERIAVEMMKSGARDYIVKDGVFIDTLSKALKYLLNDIQLEKKLAESQKFLFEKEKHLEQAQKIAHLGSWKNDFVNNIFYMSDEAYRILGISENETPNYEKFLKMIHSDDLEKVEKIHKNLLLKNKVFDVEYKIQRIDKTVRYIHERGEAEFDDTGKILSLAAAILDITDYTVMRNQLIHSEKLSAVGQLSAGIAHEFNNILAILKGSAQYFQLLEINAEMKEIIDLFLQQIDRAAGIVNQLMTFAQPRESKRMVVFLTDILNEIIKLQRKQFEFENIKVIIDYQSDGKIRADKGQLQQVFLNLIINARHAILMKNAGEIIISVYESGNNIIVKIKDTGCGMTDDIKNKIFLPFFSTKSAYAENNMNLKGTGLGLAVSQSIIENHNGKIYFESRENIGTEFFIELPKVNYDIEDSFIDDNNFYKLKNKKGGALMKNDLKILIVDDEKELLLATERFLKVMGYININIVDSGYKALELLKTEIFDIMFIDIMMPEIDGYKTVNEIRKNNQTMPIYFLSGKINLDNIDCDKYGVTGIISKPFDMQTIHNILDSVC